MKTESGWNGDRIRSRLSGPSAEVPSAPFAGAAISMNRRWARPFLIALLLLLAALLAGPSLGRIYWARRSSNPVRRGVTRAREMGCYSCHGNLGTSGLKDPGAKSLEVPAWNGGLTMMYVENDGDIRKLIREGSVPEIESSESGPADQTAPSTAPQTPARPAVSMPAFEHVLRESDLEDLVAAFKVLSDMSHPPAGGPEARGLELARSWGCFSCHGPAGSGGLPNPGSFTGFIPGWYGADYRDLVRGREEFNRWIRSGAIPRLTRNRLASYFILRQRIQMPAYRNLTPSQLDDLWAYARWLERTGGGVNAEQKGGS